MVKRAARAADHPHGSIGLRHDQDRVTFATTATIDCDPVGASRDRTVLGLDEHFLAEVQVAKVVQGLNHGRSIERGARLGDKIIHRQRGHRAEEAEIVVVLQEGMHRVGLGRKAHHRLVLVVVQPVADLALVDHVDERRIQIRAEVDVNLISVHRLGPAQIAVGNQHARLPGIARRINATAH